MRRSLHASYFGQGCDLACFGQTADVGWRQIPARMNDRLVFIEWNSCDGVSWMSLRLKRRALDEGVDEFADGELFASGRTDDFVRQILVGEAERAA